MYGARSVEDQNQRWNDGVQVSIEALIGEHGIEDDQVVVDLIYNEVLLRESRGEQPTLSDYSSRFPNLCAILERQFQVHRALGLQSLDTDDGGDTPVDVGGASRRGRMSIPGFQLLEIIGRGGSAVAWRAKDVELDREVAIKLLSHTSVEGKPGREQLLEEAKTAASLRHPSIVQVHQVGQSDEVPFLVMEYINGGSLAEKLDDGPLLPQDAAKIGAVIAEAVEFAHQNGVIHRDLKPGNILLDENQKPYVADFGLAKQLDPEETRQTTRVVGTPAYMPPEQARGKQATEKADVYSLGATMYEMLTGRPPFQSASVWDTLYQVMGNDAVPARQLNDRVPRDLETICAKCLEKLPERRYQSAGHLAADLQQFLDGKPISARPVSSFETFRRWCFKNRALAGSLLAVAGLVTTIAVGGILAAVHFQRQNQKLSVAVRNSLDAADELLVSVTEDAQLLPKSPGSQQISQRLLERAQGYFTSFVQENEGDPEMAFQLARTHAGLARVASAFEDSATLTAETNAAIGLLDEIESEGTSFDTQYLRGRLRHTYGTSLHKELKYAEAIESLKAAVEALKNASELQPDDLDVSHAYANSKYGLALSHQSSGDVESAELLLTESLEILEEIIARKPELFDAIILVSNIESTLARIRQPRSQELFESHLARSLELLEALPEDQRSSVEFGLSYAMCQSNTGVSLARKGKVTEANVSFKIAIAESKRLIALEPTIDSHKRLYAVTVLNSGYVDLFSENYQQMADRIRAVLPVADALVEAVPDNMSNVELKLMLLGNLGVALSSLEQFDEALDALDQSIAASEVLAIETRGSPESKESVALAYYQRGQILIEMGRLDEAIADVEASRKASQDALKVDPTFIDADIQLVELYVLEIEALAKKEPRPGKTIIALAEKGLEDAIATRAKHSDIYVDMAYGNLLLILAREHLDMDQPSACLEFASRVIDEFQPEGKEPEVGNLSAILGDAHVYIAKALTARKDTEDEAGSDQQRIKSAIEAAKKFGASEEQLKEIK